MKKTIYLLLLLPFAVSAQTVHVDDGRIVYKGAVKIESAGKDDLYENIKQSVFDNVKGSSEHVILDSKQDGKLAIEGKIRLSTPFNLKRTVEFLLEVNVEDGEYKYRIDSVYLHQVERGGKSKKIPSIEVYKGIEATGAESVEAEKILNQIDLRLQKMLVLIHAGIKKESVATIK